MAIEKIDAVAAFGRLRQAARDSRRKVGDVAADLLAGTPLPPARVRTAPARPGKR